MAWDALICIMTVSDITYGTIPGATQAHCDSNDNAIACLDRHKLEHLSTTLCRIYLAAP